MKRSRRLLSKLINLLASGSPESDVRLREEIDDHIALQTAENVRAGMSPAEARRQAKLKFGPVESIKEDYRAERTFHFADTLVQDIRYALRMLRKSPGFAAVAIITLALGIGANTAIFSIVDAVLLRPLPYRNSERLVMIAQRLPTERAPIFDTYREFDEWNHYSKSFEKMAAATWARDAGAILSWHGAKQHILAVPVSVNFFSMLGDRAVQGRTFGAGDLNSACTIVLAHAFWQERLGASPAWIGKSLTLDGHACTVIGVMPENFSFYPKQTKLWTLITPGSKFTQKPWDMPTLAFGLLKPGVSRSAAQAELASLQSRIISESPDWAAMKLDPIIEDLQSEFNWLTGRGLRRGLLILFAAVGFILLIACVNVANLLLGRAAVRQKELGLRAALGASRSGLIRQLLTESAVLSLFGAGLGTLLGIFCVRYITTKEAMQLPPGNPISVNWEVLVFTLVLAIVTSILFGLVPAWKASRLDLNEVLKQSGPTASRSALSHRTSRNLVVAEIALSLIVLVAAGLLVQSMIRLTTVPLGYQRHGLLTADITLPTSSYPNAADWIRFWDRLGLRLGSLPGVQAVAFAPSLATSYGTGPVTIDERGSSPRIVSASGPEPVSPGYFHVTGIPLLQGRTFSDVDRSRSVPAAVVNVAFATQFFPNGALGQRIKFGKPDAKTPWLTIVGVVGNVSRPTLYMGYSQEPCIYRPLRQDPDAGLAIYVRTTGNLRAAESEVGRAVIAVDDNLPVPTVETVDESLAWYIAEPQFRAELFSVFSALALLLAAVGIYGVLSQRVSQRIQEIGIRVALGAQRRDIVRMILGEGFVLVLIGLAIGAVGALALTRFLRSLLFDIKPTDPVTFVAVSLILAGVALLACYIPARRAMRVDPMTALRHE